MNAPATIAKDEPVDHPNIAHIRLGAAITAAAIHCLRDLRAQGVSDQKELVVHVFRGAFFILGKFVRSAGINRATIDAVLLRYLDMVYSEPTLDASFVAHIRGDA